MLDATCPQTLLNFYPNGLLVLSPSDIVIEANDQAEALLGSNLKDQPIEEALGREGPFEGSVEIGSKKLKIKTLSFFCPKDGGSASLKLVTLEPDTQKEADAQLEEILNALPKTITIGDGQGNIFFANKAYQDLNQKRTQKRAMTAEEKVTLEKIEQGFSEHEETNKSYRFGDSTIIRHNVFRPVFYSGMRKVLRVSWDVTVLERAKKHGEDIVNSMPIALMILDEKGAAASVNPALERITGYAWQEIVGKRLPEQPFITNEAIEASRSMWKDHLEKGGSATPDYEIPIRNKNGDIRFLRMSEVRIKGPNGMDSWMYIGQDTTELKEAQEKLEELVEAQQRTIKELSTPVIPVWTKVLMAPMMGSFDSQRMHELSERLLEETSRKKPTAVLLDLSGLAHVDTQVVSEVVRLIASIRPLGTRALLSGINSQVAQSLVRLGANLEGVATYATLEQSLKGVIGGKALPWHNIVSEWDRYRLNKQSDGGRFSRRLPSPEGCKRQDDADLI